MKKGNHPWPLPSEIGTHNLPPSSASSKKEDGLYVTDLTSAPVSEVPVLSSLLLSGSMKSLKRGLAWQNFR